MIPNEKCDLSEGEVAFLILLFRLCAQAEFFSDLFEGSPLAVFGFLGAFGEELHQFFVLGGGFHFFGEVVVVANIKSAPAAERRQHELFSFGRLEDESLAPRLPQERVDGSGSRGNNNGSHRSLFSPRITKSLPILIPIASMLTIFTVSSTL